MIKSLIEWLFGDDEAHKNIKTSYEELTHDLKNSDKDRLRRGQAIYSIDRSGFRGKEIVNVRTKSPISEQNDGRRTLIIEATKGGKKVGFHGVYCEKSKLQLNHGVKIYKKNDFNYHEEMGEKCYNGHHKKDNGELFCH